MAVPLENSGKTEEQQIEEKMNMIDNNMIVSSEEDIRTIQGGIDEYMSNEKDKEENF